MNKKLVNELLPLAYDTLSKKKVAVNGEIDSAFRGQIATFGAAVANGSLLAAVAGFSDQGQAIVERQQLMVAINAILQEKFPNDYKGNTLFESIRNSYGSAKTKEQILSCAVALKLAMSLYKLKKKTADG